MSSKPADFAPFYINAIRSLEKDKGNEFANKIADSQLATYSTGCIQDKIKIARKQGHANWWKDDHISIDGLKQMLVEHVEKGDMVDVAIIAMMIHARECSDFEAYEPTH